MIVAVQRMLAVVQFAICACRNCPPSACAIGFGAGAYQLVERILRVLDFQLGVGEVGFRLRDIACGSGLEQFIQRILRVLDFQCVAFS